MKKKCTYFILCLSLFLFLNGCFRQKKEEGRYNTFIQIAIPNHEGITHIRKKISPLIDSIIKEELNVAENVNFPRFLIPRWQRESSKLTVYYFNNLKKGAESQIIQALNRMQKNNEGTKIDNQISISEPIKFFGADGQYLVFSIDDPERSLFKLHKDIKKYVTEANERYKKETGEELFDKKASERFDYIPHIALGRLQQRYFPEFIKGTPEENQKVIDRIKERIKKEVFPEIRSLLKSVSTKLYINSFCFYEIASDKKIWRKCVKEYPLQRSQKRGVFSSPLLKFSHI